MSGLIALLDDVAAIAKVASASVDDIVGQAVKASSKAAGASPLLALWALRSETG